MKYLSPVNPTGFKYNHIVGTGGIGSGIFFALTGNHTLGRNESRMGTLLPVKDFCKQHIIMHYIAVLLGAGKDANFRVFPIGRVGNDDIGRSLIRQIEETGMDTGSLSQTDNFSTLFSVCFQYPDNTGGNITTLNSASSSVIPDDISSFFRNFEMSGSKEIILAVPEVPLNTRMTLLEYGRKRGSLNTASVLSSEVAEIKQTGGFELMDILSVNIDEARNIGQIFHDKVDSRDIAHACINALVKINPGISILITDGSNGTYCYTNNNTEFLPVLKVPVSSTAGAGDAFLAGTITGLCCGLSLSKGAGDKYFSESPLQSAAELGVLLASLSVTSADTIHLSANAELLSRFAKDYNVRFGTGFLELFRNCT